MAQGSTKKLEAANNIGWFIVGVDSISVDEMTADSPAVLIAQTQLQSELTGEYQDQLTAAMRAELGVETNEAAIDAVRRQLIGVN